jgi:hypothetical protein
MSAAPNDDAAPWMQPLDEAARDFVQRNVAAAPPLSDDQRTALAELLRPARQGRPTGGTG